MNKNISSIFLLTVLIALITGCKQSEEISPQQETIIGAQYLKEAELIKTVTGESLKVILNEFSSFNPGEPLSVDAYTVIHETQNYDGSLITASGLALVPKTNEKMPIISYQHGTIIDPTDIPSELKGSNTLNRFLLFMASQGYLILAADYIGYGSSEHVEHPFEHANTMGSSTYDMLRAGRELFELLELSMSEKLFLGGYSEGGYATMALHQKIEEVDNIPVTLSAPGAGAYNKSGTISLIDSPGLIIENPGAWLLNISVIKKTSGVNRPWNEIITPPNEDIITNESKSILWLTLSGLDTDPNMLFKETFLKGLKSGEDVEMIEAFKQNDLHNWVPKYPVKLYYGTEDESVHPFHAISTYEFFKDSGSTAELIPIENANHNQAVVPYWRNIWETFNSLK